MADDGNTTNEPQHYGQETHEPSPALRRLGRLVGIWELSGDVGGTVTYEWMEGGFFLIQRVNMLEEDGSTSTGMEVIGHERPLGEEPSADVKSRFYSDTGGTLDYTYELEGDTLMIWFGERGSPAYYRGTMSEDDNKLPVPGTTRVANTGPYLPGSARGRRRRSDERSTTWRICTTSGTVAKR